MAIKDRSARHDLPVVEHKPVHVVFNSHFPHFHGGHKLGPEFQALKVATVGQVGPAQASRKSHVILDAQAGAGLTTRAKPIKYDGREPFRRSIDGCGQARRSTSHNHQIEWLSANLTLEAQTFRESGDRRSWRRSAVAGDEGQLIRSDAQRLEGDLSLFLVGIDQRVRHPVLIEELANNRHVWVAHAAKRPRLRNQSVPAWHSISKASNNLSLKSGTSWITRRSSDWLTQYARHPPLA